jgi:UDP-N-acetylglucosamine 2-epimerase (non-hydrolysing)
LRPVVRALEARGVTARLIFTGQHEALDTREFGLDGFPSVDLGCRGQEDPHDHVRAVNIAILPHFAQAPDLLVVQGDTSSALGAALAAFTAGVPVAHVEAGLRTHDPMLPWPEEEYRTAIDAHADLLFAPTELAAENLRVEKAPGEIHVTGNTSIDAVLEIAARIEPSSRKPGSRKRILVTCHRRESWGRGLASIASALKDLAAWGTEVTVVLHPNQHVASKMRRLLGGTPGISLVEPCTHEQLIRRMLDADLLLSDSGGIQEEAPALGVPLIVLREKTERPEGIASGNALLVGTDRRKIVAEARRLLEDAAALAAMRRPAFPFGDGHSAERIAGILVEWLARKSD